MEGDKFLCIDFEAFVRPDDYNIDMAKHRRILEEGMGIWSFLNQDLPSQIHKELVTELMLNYEPERKCSTVRHTRVKMTKKRMAVAVGLPRMKRKCDLYVYNDESGGDLVHIGRCVLDRIVRYGQVMPQEIKDVIRMVEAGEVWMIDWGDLLWRTVRMEILLIRETRVSFYGAFLEKLLMHQKPHLFERSKADVGNYFKKGKTVAYPEISSSGSSGSAGSPERPRFFAKRTDNKVSDDPESNPSISAQQCTLEKGVHF